MYRIGIDAGSKTIKLVVLDEAGAVVHSIYKRHSSNIRRTLIEVIDDYLRRYGNVVGYAAVTGSAGIAVAQLLGLPFVQEVVADTEAVRSYHPGANVIIELGGEDAKVVYLDDPVEQRMNATCAGGTGGFIDTIASMMGIYPSEMNQYARRSQHVYPIAHRCAVFAQSDVRPLMNEGVNKEDIAASVLEAVVTQTIGGLACGRPIRGTVVFLGGPLEYIPDLVNRFRAALDLDEETGIKPYRANLYTVRGAALEAGRLAEEEIGSGADEPANLTSLTLIGQVVQDAPNIKDDLKRLEPLFSGTEEYEAFRAQHAGEAMPRASLADATGPVYLGLDMGSATVKYALLDEEGRLLASDYRLAEGDALNQASAMLDRLYANLPKRSDIYIAQTVVTGHGDEILQSALQTDSSVVDMTAHMRAALEFCPEASFVLDIGGQDTKGMWVVDGRIADSILNEPCSGGYGSFIEETANSLNCSKETFSEAALEATSPVELDAKCTVFMTSKVRHAQKAGALPGDVSAGIAYSIAQNALYRVIGRAESGDLGTTVVVQGGAFKSDAVLRAFEKLSGLHVLRPDTAELMGAIGAGLIARDRARAQQAEHAAPVTSRFISADNLAKLDPVYSAYTCIGCEEACALSLADFRDGRVFVRGNRCETAGEVVKRELEKLPVLDHLGTTSLLPRSQASKRSQTDAELGGGILIPGYMRSFSGGMAGGGGAVGGEWIQEYLTAAPFNREIRKTPSANKYTRHWGHERSSEPPEAVKKRPPVTVEVSQKNVRGAQDEAPNLINLERGLLARFSDVQGSGARAHVTVGVVNTLRAYEQLPFWHTLFSALGYSVAVPDAARARSLRVKGSESVPSESVCESAKITHERIYDLQRKGATAIFMPRFQREGGCAVECLYADVIGDNVPFVSSGEVALVSPVLHDAQAREVAHSSHDTAALHSALAAISTGDAPTEAELGQALQAALAAQEEFEAALRDAARDALAWVAQDGARHGIVLACRPYHLDIDLMHDIDNVLSKLGFAVIAPLGVDGLMGEPSHDERECPPTWPAAERLLRYTDFVVGNPQLDMVVMQSFNCGYDAVSIGDVRQRLIEAARPFTVLKVDEITDPAHIIASLESMAGSIEAGKAARGSAADERSAPEQHAAHAYGTEAVELLADGINRTDLATARMATPPGLCFTAAAIAAHAINALRDNPSLGEIRLPEVCQNCLVDALPHLLARQFGTAPAIVREQQWPQDGAVQPPAGMAQASPEAPDAVRIGIVGNPLLCFDPFMNEDIVGLLHELGVQPVLPDPELLAVDDARYVDQIERFAQQGVASVLYLQNFSCLKGHVQARGALRGKRRGSTEVPVTVLDYDPESSKLNRENRIRLVVSAAKHAAEQGRV